MSFASLVLVIGFGFLACDSDSDPEVEQEPISLMDFLIINGYDSFAEAIEKIGLDSELNGEFEYTMFVPTNAAFKKFLADNDFESLDEIPEELLTKILMNHLLEEVKRTSDFSTGYIQTMAKAGTNNNENLSLYVNKENGLLFNGVSTIESPNNEIGSGIVHGVHQVIDLPFIHTFIYPGDEHEDDPQFDAFSNVIFWNGPRFDENSSYTVFAPINDAFAALYNEYGEEEFYSEDPEYGSITLMNIVGYHIISKVNLRSENLIDGMTVTTVQGEDLIINLNGEVTLTDVNGRKSTIITKDIQAVNGVIHAVDMVLLPDINGDGE
ncbi:fasciclin domain-containing protein [Gramella sp. KN1008]|uniref:fasciclin domain-containing protein n=1 Tax=Gramella sp. KN1008 TaxID=2529298 RepID=UPI0013F178C7|nr:fasciclin domain-containing protein [Gramella sp. KN1008]